MNVLRCVQNKCGKTYKPAIAIVDNELKKCNYNDKPARAATRGWLGEMDLQSNSGTESSNLEFELDDAVAYEIKQGGVTQPEDLELEWGGGACA